MELYRHTQPGHVIRIAMAAGMLLTGAIFLGLRGTAQQAALVVLGIMVATLLICLVLFHSLTVSVLKERLELSFGPGLIRKSWPLDAIADWKTVRNPWYYGWGIHLTRNGWLYNVSGFNAVEIRLRDGKCYRIGTDAPEDLAQALERGKQN